MPGYNSGMSIVVKRIGEPKTLCVAIDGPAGAGKSTVARRVAEALGYTYVDTGAMYRSLAWSVLKEGISPTDAEAVSALAERLDVRLEPGRVWVGDHDVTQEIRTPEISNLTSPLSALPRVRRRMVALQQAMAGQGGVVMEGRDIGTVVLPEAEVKVFLTASQLERVRRRQEELKARGITLPPEQLKSDIAARDERDAGRDVAPMVPAPDAVHLDSDRLSVDEVVAKILALHREAKERHDR